MLSARLDKLINRLSRKNIFTYRIGLARTTLALGSLLTLTFTDASVLFTTGSELAHRHFSSELYFLQNVNLFGILPFAQIHYSVYLAICILILVIVGWWPRYTCILHYWVCFSFNHSTSVLEGGDQITANLVLLLIPICLLDDRKSHWKQSDSKKYRFLLEKNLIANYSLWVISRSLRSHI